MWGKKDRDEMEEPVGRPASPLPAAQTPARPPAAAPAAPARAPKPSAPSLSQRTRIGNAMVVRGELKSREDIYVDGLIEGAVKLEQGCLTIGTKGNVQADVETRSLVLLGKLKGKVQVSERIEIRKTGSFEGDIVAGNIVMEDGAVFRGSIDILRPAQPQAASSQAQPVQTGLPSIAPKPAAPKPIDPKPATPGAGVK